MRKTTATSWIVGISIVGALTDAALAQRRAPELDPRSHISSALITQADPAVMARQVTLGPELEKRLGLPQASEGAKVYRSLIDLAGERKIAVRRATPEEVAAYGERRGFEPRLPHPLYALSAGEERFLIQYDVKALSVSFIGQLGVPDPDARVIAKAITPPPAGLPVSMQPKGPTPVSLTWTGHFNFDGAALSDETQARFDAEVIPRLAEVEIRAIHVNGHADRIGSALYNQQLSERRAAALRDALIAKGADPERIEVFGYGKTLPVKACPEESTRTALIVCLAPNRRVELELHGVRRAPALEANATR
jgi:outer membrane protein OmpA-like peptidoglycan-associated protein